MDVLRIGYLSTMYHTSHLLRAMNWVQDHLDCTVEWYLFGTGPAMVDAFAADMLDIGYIGLPPAIIGISFGVPIVCIAGGHVEGTVMIGPQEIPRAVTAEDIPAVLRYLEGKKIGTPARGSIHDVIIRRLVATMEADVPEVVNYPWADLIPEAIAGHVIAAGAGTPQLAVVARRFYELTMLFGPELLWPFNPSYGIVAHTRLLKYRDVLGQFLTLHEEACNLIREKPQEAAHIIAQGIRAVDAEFVQEVFSISPRYCASLPRPYIEATMAFVPVLRELGYIYRNLTEEEIFNTSIISHIHPGAHHYTSRAPL